MLLVLQKLSSYQVPKGNKRTPLQPVWMKQDRSHAFLLHFLHLFPSLSVRMGIRKELIKNVYQKKNIKDWWVKKQRDGRAHHQTLCACQGEVETVSACLESPHKRKLKAEMLQSRFLHKGSRNKQLSTQKALLVLVDLGSFQHHRTQVVLWLNLCLVAKGTPALLKPRP